MHARSAAHYGAARHDDAARFLRLTEAEIARHGGR
jgi:hypothetical protein